MNEPNKELDKALKILYRSAVNYPCNDCVFSNVCGEKKDSGYCVLIDAFDVVHQEILRIKD